MIVDTSAVVAVSKGKVKRSLWSRYARLGAAHKCGETKQRFFALSFLRLAFNESGHSGHCKRDHTVVWGVDDSFVDEFCAYRA